MKSLVRHLLAGLLAIQSASAIAAQMEEVSIEFQGLTLRGMLSLADDAQFGSGPTVLMTHGTLAHGGMEIMAAFQELFAQQGLNSLAINLSLGQDRRQGMYDCATPHQHRHSDAPAEIAAWLDWLEHNGVKQVVLLGHSRGGNQTAWFAAENPDDRLVQKVVLVAPMTWDAARAAADYHGSYGQELAPLLAKAEQAVQAGRGGEWLEKTGFIYCPEARVQAAAFVDYYRDDTRKDTPSLLPAIKRPVLVVAGSEDTVVADLLARVRPLADDQRVRLQVIDGADHFFRDLYGEEAVEAIADFIRQ